VSGAPVAVRGDRPEDGDLDLVFHVEMRHTGSDGDETVAVLVGETVDGTALTASALAARARRPPSRYRQLGTVCDTSESAGVSRGKNRRCGF